jgi:hypothetical protein
VGVGKRHSPFGQAIQVGRFRLAVPHRAVPVIPVIDNEEQDVGAIVGHDTATGKQQRHAEVRKETESDGVSIERNITAVHMLFSYAFPSCPTKSMACLILGFPNY